MATMTEPKAEQKTLVHYMVESGVAILELAPPVRISACSTA